MVGSKANIFSYSEGHWRNPPAANNYLSQVRLDGMSGLAGIPGVWFYCWPGSMAWDSWRISMLAGIMNRFAFDPNILLKGEV